MTLIIHICVLCAVSALIEMAVSGTGAKERVRLICGLLMLKMALFEGKALAGSLSGQAGLTGIFACLIR